MSLVISFAFSFIFLLICIREAFKKKTSYLVTLSKRGGRGQNEITILGVLEIMTSLEGRGGYRISVTISMIPLSAIK